MSWKQIKEWACQRRVWAAALSAIAAGAAVAGYTEVTAAITALAGGLSLHSYVAPKPAKK